MLCNNPCECKYGHNPDPIVECQSGRVCDYCNENAVIPMRIMMVMKIREMSERGDKVRQK